MDFFRFQLSRRSLIALLLLFLALPLGVFALKTFSGDNIVIDSPVEDDVFVTGGRVEINEPVSGIIAAGGTVSVNAPVSGDVLAAGGKISINAPVGGKVIALGGDISLKESVGTNLLAAGGNVEVAPGAVIGKDAMISAGRVVNEGEIKGILTVVGGDLKNKGLAGTVRLEHPNLAKQLELLSQVINFLLIMSFFFSGIVLMMIFPELFKSTEEVIRKSPIKSVFTGLILAVASPFIIILFLLSIIGIPVAFIIAMGFVLSLMVSVLAVSFLIGRIILGIFGWHKKLMTSFTVGFVLLVILFRSFWFSGWLIVFSMLLGGGALFYAAREGFGKRKFGRRVKDWLKGSVKSVRKRVF